jgi:hypothetical protein
MNTQRFTSTFDIWTHGRRGLQSRAALAIEGMITSPQFRESPDTTNV